MRYLNLGCGLRFRPDWTNLDNTSSNPYVQAHDCRQGIPFSDNSFEVVYHSHLLEHFPEHEALPLLRECHRILQPGGIIRVAVPDLEAIARLYLCALEKARGGDDQWMQHYDWLMLEFYDQTVRERPGGAMLDYFRQNPIPNEAFIVERLGVEARRMIEAVQTKAAQEQMQDSSAHGFTRLVQSIPTRVRERCIQWLLGLDGCKALEIGRFRLSGEVHHWMYDRYSLAKLLSRAGFQNVKSVGPAESLIPHWSTYGLDTEPDGTVYKPDSFYMEATRCAGRPSEHV